MKTALPYLYGNHGFVFHFYFRTVWAFILLVTGKARSGISQAVIFERIPFVNVFSETDTLIMTVQSNLVLVMSLVVHKSRAQCTFACGVLSVAVEKPPALFC